MPDLYLGKIPVIRRSLDEGFLRGAPPSVSTGCEPRDFSVDPVEMRDSPDGMDLVPDDEVLPRLRKVEQDGNSLLHQFLRDDRPAFEHLDQNGFPDCWFHGPAHAIMLNYMRQNLPVPRLNAVAGATLTGRLNGGWSGLGMKFARDNGVPLMGTGEGEWPEHTRNKRYDTPAMREKMKLHKVTESWYDFGREVYDQKMTKRQIITASLNNTPQSWDFNRFGHAMAGVCVVAIGNVVCPVVLNSWKGFGYHGLAVLYDMWPDNAIAVRDVTT